MKRLGVALFAVVLLAGCSAPSQEKTSPESVASQAEDPAITYCELFDESLLDYTSAVSDATKVPADIDESSWYTTSTWLGRLDATELGENWELAQADYLTMRDQIDAIVEKGGGEVTFNTTAWKEGSIALMNLCSAAGFQSEKLVIDAFD